jgi:cbb3-type cytochrome oxidase maturation protein
MSVILILILASLVLAGVFLAGFIWAVRSGQFEDTCTPSMRVLTEESHSNSTQLSSTTQSTTKPS